MLLVYFLGLAFLLQQFLSHPLEHGEPLVYLWTVMQMLMFILSESFHDLGVTWLALFELLFRFGLFVHFKQFFMEVFFVLSFLVKLSQLFLSLVILHLQQQVSLLLQSLSSVLHTLLLLYLLLLPSNLFFCCFSLFLHQVFQTFALFWILFLAHVGVNILFFITHHENLSLLFF